MCSICGTPMDPKQLGPKPTCMECRKSGIRRNSRKSYGVIGCQEPRWPICWTCGSRMNRRAGTRYCSRPCQPSSRVEGRIRELRCGWCDHTFQGQPNLGHESACSRPCQNNLVMWKRGYNADPWRPGITELWSSKERRRARIRMTQEQPISRLEIFRRDRYRCHICGLATDSSARVPDPRAPTIDHVIPLSRAGRHVLSNLATACFKCNVQKSDRLPA